jgi:hypothetical protein
MNPRVVEIFDRLEAIDLEEGELRSEKIMLRTELREILERRKHSKKPVPLTFGKNVIKWEGGELRIRGKCYKFVRSLYEANKMRLKEVTLGKRVWGRNGEPKHRTFNQFVHWLADKLEKAKFPYRLLPAMSKGRTRQAEEMRNNKPIKIHEPPEIIGVKLHVR